MPAGVAQLALRLAGHRLAWRLAAAAAKAAAESSVWHRIVCVRIREMTEQNKAS